MGTIWQTKKRLIVYRLDYRKIRNAVERLGFFLSAQANSQTITPAERRQHSDHFHALRLTYIWLRHQNGDYRQRSSPISSHPRKSICLQLPAGKRKEILLVHRRGKAIRHPGADIAIPLPKQTTPVQPRHHGADALGRRLPRHKQDIPGLQLEQSGQPK